VELRKPAGGGSWAASFCDSVERAVVWAFDAGLNEKPAYLLSDSYAPVDEMAPVADLPITGSIPVSPKSQSKLSLEFWKKKNKKFPRICRGTHNAHFEHPLKVLNLHANIYPGLLMIFL
jgi:hypothetical protein